MPRSVVNILAGWNVYVGNSDETSQQQAASRSTSGRQIFNGFSSKIGFKILFPVALSPQAVTSANSIK